MGDLLALLAAVLLLAGNAFFVGAEFAMVSARRDRLEAMAAAGVAGAQTALRATSDLSRMLAASQLGITICSLLLGRLGEPAVAHLIERPLLAVGLPADAVNPVAFAGSLLLVVVAHILIGEMVPKNIAIAGPERTATWLVPPFLVFTVVMRPMIALFNAIANGVLRLLGVTRRDELETAVTSGQLAEMIADSRREGLLDDAESSRLVRALRAAQHTVADVVVRDPVTLPERPTVGDVARAVAATGFSRFPVRGADGTTYAGYLHVKDILDLIDDESAPVPAERIRGLPEVRVRSRLDEALGTLRAAQAHVARAVDDTGRTVGVVSMDDLLVPYMGDVRGAAAPPVSEGHR